MEVVDGGRPRWKNSSVAERWTKERRIEHTRQILLDAAEEVFARKGLTGAALEEIADAAGFTRGAIYSQFGAKEKLFLAVVDRQRQRGWTLERIADKLNRDQVPTARGGSEWRPSSVSSALGYRQRSRRRPAELPALDGRQRRQVRAT